MKAARAKKLKVHRYEGRIFFDQEEIAKAKETGLIKGKTNVAKKAPSELTKKPDLMIASTPKGFVKVQVEIEKDEFELLVLVLKQSNKTLNQFINEKVKALTGQVKAALSSLDC